MGCNLSLVKPRSFVVRAIPLSRRLFSGLHVRTQPVALGIFRRTWRRNRSFRDTRRQRLGLGRQLLFQRYFVKKANETGGVDCRVLVWLLGSGFSEMNMNVTDFYQWILLCTSVIILCEFHFGLCNGKT
jgi:hypothetical protein